jgi:REP element-mobilizing transposase RayT
MARKPRSLVLFDGCITHKVWRAHNKEYYLKDNNIKELYINSLKRTQGTDKDDYELNAATIMSNHVHEIMKVYSVEDFSNLMRKHHSRFGLIYNKQNNRCGKVAQERPHTTCFENENYTMEAVFYVHANPIKAGMVKDDRSYTWTTHIYYAYGIKPKWLNGLKFKFPAWYMNLGNTVEKRQRAYRVLFNKYLKKVLNEKIYLRFSKLYFHGSENWNLIKEDTIKSYFKKQRDEKKNST